MGHIHAAAMAEYAKDALESKNNPKVIFISNYKKENKGVIKITDNAGGIDEKIIDKVCEPYFTTKESIQRTGIGLYMCNEIIVKHLHGKIIVSNESFEYKNQKKGPGS